MTDIPIQLQTKIFERIVSALGNLARPFVLYSAAGSSATATVSVIWMRLDLIAGAAFITAAWGGVALLYGAKAIEERGKAKSEASVAIATAGANTPQIISASASEAAQATANAAQNQADQIRGKSAEWPF